MPTISLKTPASVDAETAALVTTAPSSEALAAPINIPSAFEGEFTAADMRIPYLAICQKSGKMMDEHPDWLGQFIYDKSVALGKKINAIFFKVRKFYVEDLPYGSDGIPQKFDKIADAREAGVDFVEVGELDCLIEVPEDFDGADQVGDKFFVPARYTVRSTAYSATVKILVKDVSLRLKGNLASGLYSIEVEKKTNGSNSWFAPKLAANGFSSPEAQEYIASRF
jgi:hypothetical protein